VRRLFFVIFAPDSQQESSPLSGRKSTQATVRICGASSIGGKPEKAAHDKACSAAVNLRIEPRTNRHRSLSQPVADEDSDEIKQEFCNECGHGV
ncbi:hypothetical protein, partial [Bradyrhizobium sp. Mp27]|uniref:hypothetical protein n=1 Tax=Bradyrhizobium sp. Mp27 TaxID=3042157 RepID=UPI00248CC5CF